MHFTDMTFNILPVRFPDGFPFAWVWLPLGIMAFMGGLLSFDDEGQALVSELMDPADVARLGLSSPPRLAVRSERQKAYLAWHRAQIWRA